MDIFTFTFVQYAFLAGLCMAVLAGVLGPMVVSSRQSVMSDMLAHVALAGVGLAAVFDLLPLAGAFLVLVASAVLLWWMSTKQWYATDALSMFFLSGGLAIALALIHVAKDQAISFENYLFGSILTVTSSELVLMGALTVITLGLVARLWYPLLGVVQTPIYRIPYSRRPEYIQLLFFVLVAVTVWVGIKTVGGLLVGALLVIPVLTVRNFGSSFYRLTVLSTIVSVTGVVVGLLIALFVDVPPSSVIILTLIAMFAVASVYRRMMGKKGS